METLQVLRWCKAEALKFEEITIMISSFSMENKDYHQSRAEFFVHKGLTPVD
jgi:hypothetical protein